MTRRMCWTGAVAAAMLAIAISPTANAASAASTITAVSINAIDLDPNDGIAAAFMFGQPSLGDSYVSAGSIGAGPFARPGGFFGALQFDLAHPPTGASASIRQGNGSYAINANLPEAVLSGAAGRSMSLDTFFAVTPRTEIRIAGDWVISASLDPACPYYRCGAEARVSAFYLLPSAPSWAESRNLLLASERVLLLAGPSFPPTKSVESMSGQFDLSFVNPSSDIITGDFAISAFAQVFNEPAPPIPEPQTYATMLAGLALIAFASRRRRRTG